MLSIKLERSNLSHAKGSPSDESLWKSFKAGNELAFNLLYKKYVQKLYDYGMHASHDENLVKDCLQDLFFRLWDRRQIIASVHSVKPYLFTSLRRLLIERITHQRKEITFSTWHEKAFDFDPSIEMRIIENEFNAEHLKRLKGCLELLTKKQREIIYLKFFSALSYQEISEITDMQVSSVYNVISKTIELFRKKMHITRPLKPVL